MLNRCGSPRLCRSGKAIEPIVFMVKHPVLRGAGCGTGVPFPEKFEILFLEMIHFGAFFALLNKI